MEELNLIKEVVKRGIEVTIRLDDAGDIVYNVNTGAKSHLHIKPYYNYTLNNEIRYTAYSRYDPPEDIGDSLLELAWAVKGCMHGRPSINQKWADVMVELGVLEKVVTTTVTYR